MKSIIELTASAKAHAEQAGLRTRLDMLRLSEWVGKGDLVELSRDGRTATFIVRARRIRIEEGGGERIEEGGGEELVFVLDHPPRPALR